MTSCAAKGKLSCGVASKRQSCLAPPIHRVCDFAFWAASAVKYHATLGRGGASSRWLLAQLPRSRQLQEEFEGVDVWGGG